MQVRVLCLAGVLAAAGASALQAHEAGDWILRGGLALVDPDGDSGPLEAAGLGPVAASGVEVKDDTQLGLTLTWMLSDRLGVELLASTPFHHEIEARTGALGLGPVDAGDTRHLPPTLSAVWYPWGSGGAFSPYLGAGVNYTWFFDDDASRALEQALGAELDLELDDSLGIALQVGVDVPLGGAWHLNAAVRWIDIETDARVVTAGTTALAVDDVEIDPWVYQLTLGYAF